jgi:hypothetical protein
LSARVLAIAASLLVLIGFAKATVVSAAFVPYEVSVGQVLAPGNVTISGRDVRVSESKSRGQHALCAARNHHAKEGVQELTVLTDVTSLHGHEGPPQGLALFRGVVRPQRQGSEKSLEWQQ